MMNLRKIDEILVTNLQTPYFIFPHGSDEYNKVTINCRKSKMFDDILTEILPHVDGDILEIGALTGTTTKVLCEAAARFNRKVFVIDPWNGAESGSESMYHMFLERTKSYSNLEVIRSSSRSQEAIERIKGMKLAFAFVDGLHTYDYALEDMECVSSSLSESGLICLDDINLPEVKKASDRFMFVHGNDWDCLIKSEYIEAFYCRK